MPYSVNMIINYYGRLQTVHHDNGPSTALYISIILFLQLNVHRCNPASTRCVGVFHTRSFGSPPHQPGIPIPSCATRSCGRCPGYLVPPSPTKNRAITTVVTLFHTLSSFGIMTHFVSIFTSNIIWVIGYDSVITHLRMLIHSLLICLFIFL